MSPSKLNSTQKETHVQKDQNVWCAIYGAGIVKRIRQNEEVDYPVLVVFNHNDDENVITYTAEGKYHVAGNVTLFTYPIEITKAAKREQLLRALERNQEQALAGMTVEQLQEELKKLD